MRFSDEEPGPSTVFRTHTEPPEHTSAPPLNSAGTPAAASTSLKSLSLRSPTNADRRRSLEAAAAVAIVANTAAAVAVVLVAEVAAVVTPDDD
eukprot:CAMPEP_0197580834 /NCGR_PEP_ID=MMETSP1326-20131121/4538_1 /TAXON_ID=1155430 /ORGANISM="Genus nov. species nov., Strain RCC2288" /LENGTH=92 /DNA_ID=CAMNT_0043144657 /DNA_START=119 /DNA_END=394 /DNA_ORIENTATION=+